jgi:hypothetical protein
LINGTAAKVFDELFGKEAGSWKNGVTVVYNY